MRPHVIDAVSGPCTKVKAICREVDGGGARFEAEGSDSQARMNAASSCETFCMTKSPRNFGVAAEENLAVAIIFFIWSQIYGKPLSLQTQPGSTALPEVYILVKSKWE